MDFILLWTAGVLLYFLPALIACARNHHQLAPIALMNLLGGWLAIPWFIALIWSVSATPKAGPATL